MTILIGFLIFLPSISAGSIDNDTLMNDASDADVMSEGDSAIDVNLEAENTTGRYGVENSLTVHVTDSDGNNVNGGSMTFENVFGRDYKVNVSNGMAVADVHAGECGQFNITCKYVGDALYKNATTKLLLNIPITNTDCFNIVATKYDNSVYFTGNVLCDYSPYTGSKDFEEVTEGNIEVYVDEVLLGNCDVDVNGNFVFIWNTTRNLIGQTINFTGHYSHRNGCFNSSTFSKNFTFEAPKDTKIITQIDVRDVGEVLISGHVQDMSGNAVMGGTITVSDFTIPVDTNGNFNLYLTSKTIPKAKYETGFMDWGSKADVTVNVALMNAIDHTPLADELIELCKKGSPYIKFGNGNGKTLVICVGTHGGELASQAAGFKLINLLADYGGEIDGTIYIFPIIFPQATANNTRIYNGTNLNVVAAENGSISNSLVKFAMSVNASGLGDFHCTRHSDSDVGITCVMSSLQPTPESFLIADFIHKETGYFNDTYAMAGVPYAGAIEDYANLNHVPAVTCEVLTNHRAIEYGSPEISFNMMRSFLRYFGFDIDEMIRIPFNNSDMTLGFASPYNYVSSSLTVSKESFKLSAEVVAKSAQFVINYDGKYSVALKDVNGYVAGKMVTFVLDGKIIGSATTDDKGEATIVLSSKILKSAKDGKKTLIIKFDDENYVAINKTVKITVNKEKAKISAKKKTFKKAQKSKKYAVFLKDSKSKGVKNVPIALKVKGKVYKSKTDSKGKATFNINKLTWKGTYVAKILFKGDNYYKKATKKVKIKIK
jgi:hypothetical protein